MSKNMSKRGEMVLKTNTKNYLIRASLKLSNKKNDRPNLILFFLTSSLEGNIKKLTHLYITDILSGNHNTYILHLLHELTLHK